MNNPDSVPFDETDGQKLADHMEYGFPKSRPARLADAYVIALNAAFGGKPRPPRTHAVTTDELSEAWYKPGNPVVALQDLLQRRFTHADWVVVLAPSFSEKARAINEHFGLISTPETDEEKWARLRREGLSDEEAAQIEEILLDEIPHFTKGSEIQEAFRKVFGIDEAGA